MLPPLGSRMQLRYLFALVGMITLTGCESYDRLVAEARVKNAESKAKLQAEEEQRQLHREQEQARIQAEKQARFSDIAQRCHAANLRTDKPNFASGESLANLSTFYDCQIRARQDYSRTYDWKQLQPLVRVYDTPISVTGLKYQWNLQQRVVARQITPEAAQLTWQQWEINQQAAAAREKEIHDRLEDERREAECDEKSEKLAAMKTSKERERYRRENPLLFLCIFEAF